MERCPDLFAHERHGTVVVATYDPGFSADLSSWRLTLDLQGRLIQQTQIIDFESPSHNGERHDEVQVGADFVAFVLKRADELDFWNLTIHSSAMWDDLPSLLLGIRQGDRVRSWHPYGVQLQAREDEAAKSFMELWCLIHSRAPFPPKAPA